jgi:chromosome segregation ATPase
MKQQQVLIAVAVILALLLIGSGIWGFQQSKARKSLESQNTELTGTVDELEELRAELVADVDSLTQEYYTVTEQNSELEGSLAQAQEAISQKEAAIRNIKASTSSEINSLRAQIQELIDLKAALESDISNVQAQNDSLRTVAGQLESDLQFAEEENEALSALNRSIEDEVDRLTLANFKASAFEVTMEKGNDKITAKARRARAIRTSFDLTNVPAEYQGLRTIYLVITDDKGNPIDAKNPIKAQTVANGQKMDIIAVKAKDEDITANQRLSFVYDLEDKLDPGYYRVAIYTDIGLLGASSVRLR